MPRKREGAGVSKTLALSSDMAEVCAAAQHVAEFCRRNVPQHLGCNYIGAGIELTMTEVLTNIIRHAYGLRCGRPISVAVDVAPERIEIHVRDCGTRLPFDTLKAAEIKFDPDDTPNLPEGGFGWPLIARQMDDMCYCREGGENHLVLIKNLQCAKCDAPALVCPPGLASVS